MRQIINFFSNLKIRYLLLFLIPSILISCDYLYRFKLENESNDELLVKFSFDKDHIDTYWNGSVESCLKFDLGRLEIVSFDTLEYNIVFKLPANKDITIDAAVNVKPDFSKFKKVEVFKKDSILFLADKQILRNLYQEGKNDNFKIY